MTVQDPTPSPPGLRDLTRPLLANAWLIVTIVVVAVGASVAFSVSRPTRYTATATLKFQDETRDLSIVGVANSPSFTAEQLAGQAAQTVAQPQVLTLVKRALATPLSGLKLAASVSTTVASPANLVQISAQSGTALEAQRLANAFANATAQVDNESQRARYSVAIKALEANRPSRKDVNGRLIFDQEFGRLRALSVIASPAQVLTTARRPTAPSSPRPLRDGVLAGILGLVVGVLLGYVRDALDRRLRYAADIQHEMGLTLLGHVRDDTMGHNPIPGSKLGASGEDWELFRILRQNLDYLDSGGPPRTVAVTSAVAQEGKTTVATFLAFASAATGKSTLLIEADLRRPVLADRLEINHAPGLTDYLTEQADPQAIVQSVAFTDAASPDGPKAAKDIASADSGFVRHVACITAGTKTSHPAEMLRSDRLKQMLAEVGKAYDVVVIDTPPVLAVVDTLELLSNVTTVVLCVRAQSTTREQALAGKAAIERQPPRAVGLVVTGTKRRDDAEYGYAAYY